GGHGRQPRGAPRRAGPLRRARGAHLRARPGRRAPHHRPGPRRGRDPGGATRGRRGEGRPALSDAGDPIVEVRCWQCSVPLPRPLLVGAQRVTARSYLLVRVRSAGGGEGVGLAFARGLPLARIVADGVSPLLLGQDAGLPESVRTALAGALW